MMDAILMHGSYSHSPPCRSCVTLCARLWINIPLRCTPCTPNRFYPLFIVHRVHGTHREEFISAPAIQRVGSISTRTLDANAGEIVFGDASTQDNKVSASGPSPRQRKKSYADATQALRETQTY